MAKADHARLAVVPTDVFDPERDACEDGWRILEVEFALIQRPLSFGRIAADPYGLL